MLLTYETEMDEQGVIRLGDLIRSPKRRRVRVTLLNDVSTAALSEPALSDWDRAEEDEAWVDYQESNDVEARFQAEADTFDQLLPKLLQTYPEQFVAIHDGDVIAHGDDKLQMLRDVREAHGQIVCYVDKVTTTPRIARITSAHIKS